jgi:hypothetical protein
MQQLISDASKIGFGGPINLLENVDLTPSLNTKLNGYIISIDNLGTLRVPNTALVLQKEIDNSIDENLKAYHSKIVWTEHPLNVKDYFKTISKYSHTFYGELYSIDTPPIQRDTLDQGFFNFIRINKNFNNEDTHPLLDYVRFSFPKDWGVHNTKILSGIKSVPVTGFFNSGLSTGIIDYIDSPNVYNFEQLTGNLRRSFVTGNLATLNAINNINNFIYNKDYSGYVIYPQSIYLHQLPRLNIDTVITQNSISANSNLNGILLISTGNHYSQKIVYISPHSGSTRVFNTVVETFETSVQNFKPFNNFRCKKYINPSDPRSCSFTGYTGILNYVKTSYGISVPGIDVNSIYVNNGFVFPTGLISKSPTELANLGDTGIMSTWPISGLITNEMLTYLNTMNSFISGSAPAPDNISFISGLDNLQQANLNYFVSMLLDCNVYKVNNFLKQEIPIQNTLFYKLYSGLYTGNKTFNLGTWNGIIPSGTTVFMEYLSTNEEPCGTNADFLLVHSNYGDNSLIDVSIKKSMGLSLLFDTSISKEFTSISFNSMEDGFWKNFQKFEVYKRNLYVKNIINKFPLLMTQTNRMKRSLTFFNRKRLKAYPSLNTFSRRHSNFKLAPSAAGGGS